MPETVEHIYKEARALERLAGAGALTAYQRDVVTIAEMLIPLDTDANGYRHFTCAHFDADAGRCTIYEDRPAMCRNYPYGIACTHCGFSGGLHEVIATLDRPAS